MDYLRGSLLPVVAIAASLLCMQSADAKEQVLDGADGAKVKLSFFELIVEPAS